MAPSDLDRPVEPGEFLAESGEFIEELTRPGLDHQSADVVQQTADLAQRVVSRADDLARTLSIRNRLAQARDFTSQCFTGNQAGRVIRTTGARPP